MELKNSDQALDFYFQGLRKDYNHFGCCYNLGITFLDKQMHKNAKKWFQFARLIDPKRKEPYLGEAISSMKLGDIAGCSRILRKRPGVNSLSRRLKKLVADFDASEPNAVSILNTEN